MEIDIFNEMINWLGLTGAEIRWQCLTVLEMLSECRVVLRGRCLLARGARLPTRAAPALARSATAARSGHSPPGWSAPSAVALDGAGQQCDIAVAGINVAPEMVKAGVR